MPRFIEYTVFFFAVVILQVFLFENLNLGIYIHPLVYISFIILLPMEMPAVWVLLLGLSTGMAMDATTGSGGLHTIATVATSFARPYLLPLVLGREEVKGGGIPLPARLGPGRFLRYAGMLVVLHCTVFFTFESLSWKYYHLTLLRVAASSVVTLVLLYIIQTAIPGSRDRSQNYR
ncbi:MAG: rod shape-determining protein MreD [Rikenellaceae bacterium]|nr:rod shape-determining protein MreD [Rikenellaceae bacterium]